MLHALLDHRVDGTQMRICRYSVRQDESLSSKHAKHTRRSFAVSSIGLVARDRQRERPVHAKSIHDSTHLDRVAERRAKPLRLYGADIR